MRELPCCRKRSVDTLPGGDALGTERTDFRQKTDVSQSPGAGPGVRARLSPGPDLPEGLG